MANPWNSAALPTEEHKLSDIMSEELSKRLQIEDDFVWVDVLEVQRISDMLALTKHDSVLSDTEITPFTNIAQSELEHKIFEFEEIGNPYGNEDSSTNQWDIDEGLDVIYKWKSKKLNDNKRQVNVVKCTSMPQNMKHTEHSTRKITNISLNNSKKQKNKDPSLLPTIDFGEATNALLKRIIDQRYVGRYNHVAGMGKNSVVFNAPCHRRNCITITFINAVKVYKLSNNENENKGVYKRVQREFEHLHTVYYKLGNCPKPFRAWDNVILMSFSGADDINVAPTLKDITPTEDMYWVIVSYIDEFYNKLHLVHGKLCSKNIMYLGSVLKFIGWGHSVKRDHPQALLKLIKDCHNVTKFYTQSGFKVKSTEDLFKGITGCTKINSKLLDVIKKKDLYEKYDENPNRRYPSAPKPNGNLRFK